MKATPLSLIMVGLMSVVFIHDARSQVFQQTFTYNYSNRGGNATTPFDVPQFNPSLGILVGLSVSDSMSGTLAGTADDNSLNLPGKFEHYVNVLYSLTPFNALESDILITKMQDIAAGNQTITYGPEFLTFGAGTEFGPYLNTQNPHPEILQAFTGTGATTVNQQFQTTSTLQTSIGGIILPDHPINPFGISGNVGFTYFYTSTPEPGPVALLVGVAIPGVAFLMRRCRRRK